LLFPRGLGVFFPAPFFVFGASFFDGALAAFVAAYLALRA